MSEPLPQSQIITGIHEQYEGLRSFNSFQDYLDGWIRPNILADLETVFVGAGDYWSRAGHPSGAPGRGDFLLAMALLGVMDHLGAFLFEGPEYWITPVENIARVACRLESTFDIPALLGNLGRNALMHGAWPQTAVPYPPDFEWGWPPWGIGLSFNANLDASRHNTVHVKSALLVDDKGKSVPHQIVKLVLNVHNLREELVDSIQTGRLFANLQPDAFSRVRDGATFVGYPDLKSLKKLDSLYRPMPKDVNWKKYKLGRPRPFDSSDFWLQARMIKAEAEQIGAWNGKPTEKYKRNHVGRKPPWKESAEKCNSGQ